MSKIKPSTTHELQRRFTPKGQTQGMTQIVDFEVLDNDDSVFIMYWYDKADAETAKAGGQNFVPIPYNGINLHPNNALVFSREASRAIWNGLVKEGWSVATSKR